MTGLHLGRTPTEILEEAPTVLHAANLTKTYNSYRGERRTQTLRYNQDSLSLQ